MFLKFQCWLENIMKFIRNVKFWIGVISVYMIVFSGVITVTYYGTRLPVGTLTQYSSLTQAQ